MSLPLALSLRAALLHFNSSLELLIAVTWLPPSVQWMSDSLVFGKWGELIVSLEVNLQVVGEMT